jgi:hypothetical protein
MPQPQALHPPPSLPVCTFPAPQTNDTVHTFTSIPETHIGQAMHSPHYPIPHTAQTPLAVPLPNPVTVHATLTGPTFTPSLSHHHSTTQTHTSIPLPHPFSEATPDALTEAQSKYTKRKLSSNQRSIPSRSPGSGNQTGCPPLRQVAGCYHSPTERGPRKDCQRLCQVDSMGRTKAEPPQKHSY